MCGATLTLSEHQSRLPSEVRDAVRFQQVLANLLENAITFSPDGGTVEACVSGGAEMLCIVVRDHGIGIAPSDQLRIFERFGRGANALEQGIRGTGLGLFICRQIVERMGGAISVRSALGRGTTVTVELPTIPACRAGCRLWLGERRRVIPS